MPVLLRRTSWVFIHILFQENIFIFFRVFVHFRFKPDLEFNPPHVAPLHIAPINTKPLIYRPRRPPVVCCPLCLSVCVGHTGHAVKRFDFLGFFIAFFDFGVFLVSFFFEFLIFYFFLLSVQSKSFFGVGRWRDTEGGARGARHAFGRDGAVEGGPAPVAGAWRGGLWGARPRPGRSRACLRLASLRGRAR